MKHVSLVAAGLAWLVSCSSGLAAVPPAACPSEPIRVVRSRGGVIDYDGTAANVPDLCRVTRQDGTGFFYYGGWRSDWPGAGDAYPAIKNVILGQPGTRIDFVTRSLPGMQWIDSFIHEGFEPVVVDGVTYTTLRLAHERRGIEGNTYHSVITSWRDVRTGIVLRTFEHQIAGRSYGPNTTWEAVRVIRPPAS